MKKEKLTRDDIVNALYFISKKLKDKKLNDVWLAYYEQKYQYYLKEFYRRKWYVRSK